ncbi:MAG: VanZ family protein [Coriobacteriales bacterium]|jgi:glycopeptide antibiotics resistance protein|nr:VanZ family protein [Coriobacteriales bacterium]
MNDYSYPISTAALHFALIALLFTIPFVFVQYIRYGSVSKWRAVVLFSFCYYLLAAFYLVILPLPDPAQTSGWVSPTMQLMPFRFVSDIAAESTLVISDYHSYLPALTQSVIVEPLFNILLTVPFGVYLQYYFRRSFLVTLLLTVALTLFFELTQLSGLYGIYPRPYRLFDVDDLLLNTLGGVLGWLAARRALVFLPTREQIDRKNVEKSAKVGYIRRLFALLIDYLVVLLPTMLVGIALGEENVGLLPFATTSLLMLYFLVAHAIFGRTVGKALVHLRMERIKTGEKDAVPTTGPTARAERPAKTMRPPFLPLLVRYGILCAAVLMLQLLNHLVVTVEANGIYALAHMAILLFVVLDLVRGLFFGKLLAYELVSGLRNVNTKMPADRLSDSQEVGSADGPAGGLSR